MRSLILSLLLIFVFEAKSQNAGSGSSERDSTGYKYILMDTVYSYSYKPKSPFTALGALSDIQDGKVQILFDGSFFGIPDLGKKKEDRKFQRKYKVKFQEVGCIRFGDDENREAYNSMVFAFLDSKYGLRWREEIRKKAIGLF